MSAFRTVSLPVTEFAVPVPRRGSIDIYSGYGRAREDGIEIHQRVQAERRDEHENYEAEVKVSHTFENGGYTFEVGGRMDGFYSGEPARIEEIKTTFNIRELARRLTADHPYRLQLQTYGYFHYLQHDEIPDLVLHLVSTRNGDSLDVEVELDLGEYRKWLDLRLAELALEAKRAEKRAERRRKLASTLEFPFDRPRAGQIELVETIQSGFGRGKRLLLQAPTGLGKTAGVLFPALQDALARAQPVIYVTPKNSQHSVAEDAISRFQERGSDLKSLTITAKSKICMKAEPLCNPDYCEFARDHHTKVAENELIEKLDRKKRLTSKAFSKLAEEFEVCPFELQFEALHQADTVICDYNYVFAPRSALALHAAPGVQALGREGKATLVIDEAHNLPSRSMDYYSPALSSVTLDKMREEIRELPSRFRGECEMLLDDCIQVLLDCKPREESKNVGRGGGQRITPPAEPFLDQEVALRSFLTKYLESDIEIQPGDVVLRLCFYWSEFTSALDYVRGPLREEFFTTYHPHPSGGTVRITCCDASSLLRACYDDFENVVAFSATLKPFDYYLKLSGLIGDTVETSEFSSPFKPTNRKVLVIPQISTKYSERERSTPKIIEVISRLSVLRPGNYFVFFPSFEFLEKVLAAFHAPEGFRVLRQERFTKPRDVEALLDTLREGAEPTLVFAVQGGVFSEGVDYPGDMVIGAFVIGPPLPSFDLEREEMRKYYDARYRQGFDFAYTFPAMAKAIQAAGRVIRTETDRGIIVLMDSRFLQPAYSQSMPKDWFVDSPHELVSQALIRDIQEFWDGSP